MQSHAPPQALQVTECAGDCSSSVSPPPCVVHHHPPAALPLCHSPTKPPPRLWGLQDAASQALQQELRQQLAGAAEARAATVRELESLRAEQQAQLARAVTAEAEAAAQEAAAEAIRAQVEVRKVVAIDE